MNLTYSNQLIDNVDYLSNFCSNWDVEASHGKVSLYTYHDSLDWCFHYAIVIDNEVKHLLKDIDYSQAYLVYESIIACLN